MRIYFGYLIWDDLNGIGFDIIYLIRFWELRLYLFDIRRNWEDIYIELLSKD